MLASTVTSKGQVTIPAEVRYRLGIDAGDRLVFEIEGEEIRIRVISSRSLEDLFGAVRPGRTFPGVPAVREETARDLRPARRRT